MLEHLIEKLHNKTIIVFSEEKEKADKKERPMSADPRRYSHQYNQNRIEDDEEEDDEEEQEEDEEDLDELLG